jgi:hypothetical protein
MSIINRDLSTGLRRQVFQNEWSALPTGSTIVLAVVPYLASLDVVQLYAFGLSGAPTAQILVNRFIPGVGVSAGGFTVFNLGSTQALPSYGTSGVLSVTFGFSLPQIGSTLTTLFANDVIFIQTGGTNAAVTGLVGAAVLRPLQDIIQHFGIL